MNNRNDDFWRSLRLQRERLEIIDNRARVVGGQAAIDEACRVPAKELLPDWRVS